MVTIMVKGVPSQPFTEVGVTVYSTVIGVALLLVIVPDTFPVPDSFNTTPITVPVIWVTSQLKVLATVFPPTALILSCGSKSKGISEETVSVKSIPKGSEFTVTVTVKASP